MNPNFFNLPHVFVVFSPGTGGNFISGLIHRIVNNDYQDLAIQSAGSSHNVTPNCMNFGTSPQETFAFGSKERQEKYYLEKIIDKYSNTTAPVVTWSHDFSNIILYRKYFKNSKIISISCNSDKEKLSGIFFNTTKMLINDVKDWPIDQRTAKFLSSALETHTKMELKGILKPQYVNLIDHMYDQRFSDQYKNIINFSIIRTILKYSGLLNKVDTVSYKELQVIDYLFYQHENKQSTISYCIEYPLTYYHQLCDRTIPFNYLSTKNLTLLESILEYVNGSPLNEDQSRFVNESFEKYLSAQNHVILNDPYAFYSGIKASVRDFIKFSRDKY